MLSQARRGGGLGAGKGVLREKRQTPEIVVRKFNLNQRRELVWAWWLVCLF